MSISVKQLWAAFIILVTALPTLAAGSMPEKVALIIGNQRYIHDKPLPNATNDATLMGKTLSTLGFSVTIRTDLDRAELAAAVTEFTNRIPEGATALVYYAGHGMQVGGSNFLNPIDMQITSEQKSPLRAYPLRNLLERLALAKSAVNIVILDACRNNPFRHQEAVRYRSFQNLGLSRMHAPRGTLIAYSTAPGQLSADGDGSNSVYTLALTKEMSEPGREVEEIFKQTSSEVRRKTLDDQIPWYESSLTDKYYFLPPKEVTQIAGKVLKHAATGPASRSPSSRQAGTTAQDKELWYRKLTASDWNQLDWETQQRVRRLTPDEIPQLEHKAHGGNVLAQLTLGLAYREGLDKAVGSSPIHTMRFHANNRKALQWIRKAAEAGFPIAQTELGEMYYVGHGVGRNLDMSRHWISSAARAEYPRAKLDLLQLHMEVSPLEVDAKGALQSIQESLTKPPNKHISIH